MPPRTSVPLTVVASDHRVLYPQKTQKSYYPQITQITQISFGVQSVSTIQGNRTFRQRPQRLAQRCGPGMMSLSAWQYSNLKRNPRNLCNLRIV